MKLDTNTINLDNRIILITGAGDGIGKAVALACAARGASVILLGKTVKKLEAVYDAIEAQGSPQPAIYPLDLEKAQAADYQILHDTIANEFGVLHGLLNNAGWLGASTPVEHYDAELWHRVMQINLNACFLLAKACIPLLAKSSHATMLFTTDDKRSAYWGAYGVAKAGQLGLMQILADELENRHIAVNAFDPGPLRTRLRTRAYPGEDPTQLKTPNAVASAFAYLLSAAIANTTGKVFSVEDFAEPVSSF